METRTTPADILAIAICTLCWGTTWYAITLQFGVVDPVVSVVYRFALASALLFAWCALRRETMQLTPPQHLAAIGIGFFTFACNYALVYWAEERVTSAVVAVMFAAMSFVNLVGFRIVFGQRAAPMAWFAACLGIVGVGLMSWQEIAAANFGVVAMAGIGLTLGGVIASAAGNIYARNAETAGASIAASTAWSMLYGTVILAVFALITGRVFVFDTSPQYLLSLLHLAVNGSVIAFMLYYWLARRRGFALASYISALTPPVAMIVSSLFEGKSWGMLALSGVALVLAGQWLLLRTKRA